jgi:hypothetical protein
MVAIALRSELATIFISENQYQYGNDDSQLNGATFLSVL